MISVYLSNSEAAYLLVYKGSAWWLDTKRDPSTVPEPKCWWTSNVHYALAYCNYLFDVSDVNDIVPLHKMETLMND